MRGVGSPLIPVNPIIRLKKCKSVNTDDPIIYGTKVKQLSLKKKSPHKRQLVVYSHEDDPDIVIALDVKLRTTKRLHLSDRCFYREHPSFDLRPFKFSEEEMENILTVSEGKTEVCFLFEKNLDKIAWIQKIENLKSKSSSKFRSISVIAQELFFSADKNQRKVLKLSQVIEMFRLLRLNMDKSVIEMMFNKYDANKNKELDMQEFEKMASDIFEKPELKKTYTKYNCNNGNMLITREQFELFLKDHQKEKELDNDAVLAVFNEKSQASFKDFCCFLFSDGNSIISPDWLAHNQDMDLPLIDYYVNSSHNTYLTGHQLHGEASIEIYAKALLAGCRSVEIDLWVPKHLHFGLRNFPKIHLVFLSLRYYGWWLQLT